MQLFLKILSEIANSIDPDQTAGFSVAFTLFEKTELEFYGLVNTVKVMLSQSVNLLTLFQGRLSSLSGEPVLMHILLPVIENCSSRISGRGRMTVEMILWSISMKVIWQSWDSNSQMRYRLCYGARLRIQCFYRQTQTGCMPVQADLLLHLWEGA